MMHTRAACFRRWKTSTDLTGWQVQNSLDDKFADAVVNQAFATTEVNLRSRGDSRLPFSASPPLSDPLNVGRAS